MIRRTTAIRTLHDLGLAAWFGGTLMGAVGVNGASQDMAVRDERVAIATDAWGRFSPVGAVAIGAHLVGSFGLLVANRDRVLHQRGVAAVSGAKAAVTGVALGATGYAWYLGTKLGEAGSVSAAGGTVPSGETPADVVAVQQQLRALQWAIPVSTGAVIALSALAGEQQRADQQLAGTVGRVVGRGRRGVARQQKKVDRAARAAVRAAGSTGRRAVDATLEAAPW